MLFYCASTGMKALHIIMGICVRWCLDPCPVDLSSCQVKLPISCKKCSSYRPSIIVTTVFTYSVDMHSNRKSYFKLAVNGVLDIVMKHLLKCFYISYYFQDTSFFKVCQHRHTSQGLGVKSPRSWDKTDRLITRKIQAKFLVKTGCSFAQNSPLPPPPLPPPPTEFIPCHGLSFGHQSDSVEYVLTLKSTYLGT